MGSRISPTFLKLLGSSPRPPEIMCVRPPAREMTSAAKCAHVYIQRQAHNYKYKNPP